MNQTHRVGKLLLMSYVAGDLPPERATAVQVHLETCGACREQLSRLREAQDEFLRTCPAPALPLGPAATLSRRASRTTWFVPGAVYALAASIVLVVGARVALRSLAPDESFRIKGEVRVDLFVRNGDAIERRTDHVYYPGENIQFSYSSDARNCLVLLSIDQTGKISTYFPSGSDSSLRLETGRSLPLPSSIVLDDYIGKELYVAVFSSGPLAVGDLAAQLREAFEATPDLENLQFQARHGIVRQLLTTKRGRP